MKDSINTYHKCCISHNDSVFVVGKTYKQTNGRLYNDSDFMHGCGVLDSSSEFKLSTKLQYQLDRNLITNLIFY